MHGFYSCVRDDGFAVAVAGVDAGGFAAGLIPSAGQRNAAGQLLGDDLSVRVVGRVEGSGDRVGDLGGQTARFGGGVVGVGGGGRSGVGFPDGPVELVVGGGGLLAVRVGVADLAAELVVGVGDRPCTGGDGVLLAAAGGVGGRGVRHRGALAAADGGLRRAPCPVVGGDGGAGLSVRRLGELGGVAPPVIFGGLGGQLTRIATAAGDRACGAGGADLAGPFRAAGTGTASGRRPVPGDRGAGVTAVRLGQRLLGDAALGVVLGAGGQLQPVGVLDLGNGQSQVPVVGGLGDPHVGVGGIAVDRGTGLGCGEEVLRLGVGGTALVVGAGGVLTQWHRSAGRDEGLITAAAQRALLHAQVSRLQLVHLALAVVAVGGDGGQLLGALGSAEVDQRQFGEPLLGRLCDSECQLAVGGRQFTNGVTEGVVGGGIEVATGLGGIDLPPRGVHVGHLRTPVAVRGQLAAVAGGGDAVGGEDGAGIGGRFLLAPGSDRAAAQIVRRLRATGGDVVDDPGGGRAVRVAGAAFLERRTCGGQQHALTRGVGLAGLAVGQGPGQFAGRGVGGYAPGIVVGVRRLQRGSNPRVPLLA